MVDHDNKPPSLVRLISRLGNPRAGRHRPASWRMKELALSLTIEFSESRSSTLTAPARVVANARLRAIFSCNSAGCAAYSIHG